MGVKRSNKGSGRPEADSSCPRIGIRLSQWEMDEIRRCASRRSELVNRGRRDAIRARVIAEDQMLDPEGAKADYRPLFGPELWRDIEEDPGENL